VPGGWQSWDQFRTRSPRTWTQSLTCCVTSYKQMPRRNCTNRGRPPSKLTLNLDVRCVNLLLHQPQDRPHFHCAMIFERISEKNALTTISCQIHSIMKRRNTWNSTTLQSSSYLIRPSSSNTLGPAPMPNLHTAIRHFRCRFVTCGNHVAAGPMSTHTHSSGAVMMPRAHSRLHPVQTGSGGHNAPSLHVRFSEHEECVQKRFPNMERR
jgi:hypothetical protein